MISRFFISDPDKDAPEAKIRDKQLRKLIPNIVTLASIVCGLTAIQMAIGDEWRNAILLILIATVLDTLDGALARLLKATSKFGAELDSLADFLSFGIAPATIMYLWVLQESGRVGWIAALVFVIASALRLARFNSASEAQEKKPEWGKYFFSGVPAPAGSGLALMPMIAYLQLGMDLSEYSFASPIIGVWIFIVAVLMVSRLPTFSSKQIRLPSIGLIPTLSVIGLILAMLVHAPWLTLNIACLIYIVSLPISYKIYQSREKRATKA